jgi:prepilin-type N-terminal cleavage/methylation domain-containing protein
VFNKKNLNRKYPRHLGFSLIETMIAAALLGLIGAAVATVLSFAAREAGQSRLRTIASANARETLDRVAQTVRLAEHHRMTDAGLCALLEYAAGPMDKAAPATQAGACPNRTIGNIAIPGTLIRRQVQITALAANANEPRRYQVDVTISGTGLTNPVTARTIVLRDSK